MKRDFSDFVSIQLNKTVNEPLYVQLYQQIENLIKKRALSPGYALPPIRQFAGYLSINPSTVVSAYKELEKNGYLFSRTGSGSYVAELPEIIDLETPSFPVDIDVPDPEILPCSENYSGINMSAISLNPDIVSVETFKQLMIEILDRDQGHAFSYQESQGFQPLRESIAAYLQENGVHTPEKNVQIISGAQQGIDIAARALLQHGDCVFVESPTYPGALAAFRSRGAKIIDIPLEEDGIAIDELEAMLRTFRPRLLYLMPNIQNPTGISYSIKKRNRLMGLARYYHVYILEDDYISELTYEKNAPAPLKALDRDDRVIYLKSFSKIFMPGLRLGFLTMPAKLAPRLLSVKHLSDISTSGLTQRIFDLYLRRKVWQNHIASIRQIYQTQFDFTWNAAKKYLPETCRITPPQGGLSLWVELPPEISADALCLELEHQGVCITNGRAFFPRQAPDRYIRISYATISLQQIQTGMRLLGSLLQAHAEKNPPPASPQK